MDGSEISGAIELPVPKAGEILTAVFAMAPADEERLAGIGRTVRLEENLYITLIPAGRMEEITSIGAPVQIFMPRTADKTGGSPVARSALPGVYYQPWIQSRVDAVSTDSLMALCQTLQDFGNRRSNTAQGAEAGALLFDRFIEYGYTDVSYFDYNMWCDDVIAVKPGLYRPDEIVLIGGHYDSISRNGTAPGADDNATGTTTVLEVARLLAGSNFERTLVFAAFSGEEQGLVGSAAFAEWAAHSNWNIIAMINVDMIGYVAPGDDQDLDLITRSEAQELVDYIKEVAPLYVPELPIIESQLSGGDSDHTSFLQNGYQAVFFFEDAEQLSPYIHSELDLIGMSLNSFDFMTKCVKVSVATIASLAAPFTIQITHEPLAEDLDPLTPFEITATIRSAGQLVPSGLNLFYRAGEEDFSIVPLEEAGSDSVFKAWIPAQPLGVVIEYYIEATDEEGRTAHHPMGVIGGVHRVRVGFADIFVDDFEEDLGWVSGADDDTALSGQWTLAEPVETPYQPGGDHTGGGLCWVTGNGRMGDSPGDWDVDAGKTTLLSPVFDLTDVKNPEISYWLWYHNGPAISQDDTMRVDISNDNGTTWNNILKLKQHTPGWTYFKHVGFEDSLVCTKEMKLRFVAEDEGVPSIVEALVDDVAVRASRITYRGMPDSVVDLLLEGGTFLVWPSPFRDQATFALRVIHSGDASLNLYDVRGRLVKNFSLDSALPGYVTVPWDGRASNGERVESGIYWLRFRDGAARHIRRIVRVR